MKVYISAPLSYQFETGDKENLIKLVDLVDSILKESKLSTYITYRDFLQWGKVTYNPNTVFEKLNLELKTSDLLVVLNPEKGIGPNITLGMATALKKYIIILLDKNFDIESLPGLMYQGLNKITKCKIVTYEDMNDLRKKLKQAIKSFLKEHK